MNIKIGRNIIVINKYFKAYLKEELKEYKLNSAEGLVLLILYGKDGITQEQIIEEIQHDKGVMTRTMQSLEDKGYIIRNKNTNDNRSFNFYLTKKGKEFKNILIAILKIWNDNLLNDLTEYEIDIVNQCMEKMAQNATKYIKGGNKIE